MNRLNDVGIIILGVIISLCALGGIISSLYLGDDNPIEELLEKVIEEETGVDVDLTPSSPEK